MKKVIATLLLVSLFGGLFLFGIDRSSAEESAVFRLYPLTENNIMDEKAVIFGSLDFSEQVSYTDKKGVKRIHTHNGVDIMAAANTTKVYPYKDSDAYVVRNNTDPKFGRTYDTAFDTYWNSFLVVYYPSLQLYVYYGHIVSDLAPESKIDTNKPLGTIREAYNSNNIRSTAIDHLHLSVSPKDVATGWGYSEGALSTDDVKRQGWLDPIEFMRGNGEKLQEYLEEQANNTIPNSESAATISEEISNPNFLQSIARFFQSLQNEIIIFLSNIVKPVYGAENGNQISFATAGNATAGNATAGNATAGNSVAAESSQVPGAAGASETLGNPIEDGTFIISLNPNEAEIGDFYIISTESEPYQTTTVNGGFLLKCAVCEFVTISYDEYTRMAAGETIQTAAGEIGHTQDISDYSDIEYYSLEAVVFNEGRYFINQIPDANLPELLRDPYYEIWTNAGNEGYPILSGAQQCEYFISDETMLELFDYGNASATPFGDYLVFGNSEMIWSYTFLATVQNNEIIHLEEICAALDE